MTVLKYVLAWDMQLFWFEVPMTASYSSIECVLLSHLMEPIKTWAGFSFLKEVFTTYETGTSSIWIHWNKGFFKEILQAILRNTHCYLVSINNGFCETTWSPSKRPVLILCWMGFLWIRMVSMSCSQVSDSIHPSLCRLSTVQIQTCRIPRQVPYLPTQYARTPTFNSNEESVPTCQGSHMPILSFSGSTTWKKPPGPNELQSAPDSVYRTCWHFSPCTYDPLQ